MLAHYTRLLAGGFDHAGQFGTDGLAEGDVRHHAVSEKSVHAVTGAVEELIWDHELQRLVLFFQRPDRGDGDDAFHAQLLEAVNVGAEIEFTGKNAVSSCMTRQKSDLAALQRAADVGVGRRAERSSEADFFHFSQ